MKIAVFQFDPQFGDKEFNLKKIEDALQKTQAELVVLPELCVTGYQFTSKSEVNELCEPAADGETVRRFSRICKQKNLHIVGGIAEKDGDKRFNSSVLVGPKGLIGVYRKIHLFMEEKLWFSPGNIGFRVWDIGQCKIGMMICFDWIIPEAAGTLARKGADVICHPVNLVLPFCQDAMVTRSIENRVFTITANRIGTEERGGKPKITYTGASQAVGPDGRILFRMDTKKEELREVEIDPRKARDKNVTPLNHLVDDRRPEFYL
jgi:predicted amidohydrolase